VQRGATVAGLHPAHWFAVRAAAHVRRPSAPMGQTMHYPVLLHRVSADPLRGYGELKLS
jgi:hypothetical protein